MSTVVKFPVSAGNVQAASKGLSDAVESGRVRAVAVISIEIGEKGEPIVRIRNGWDEQELSVFEVLAFSAAVDHTKNAILEVLET